MKSRSILPTALALLLGTGCVSGNSEPVTGPPAAGPQLSTAAATVVDIQDILVPPPGFPQSDLPFVETAQGRSRVKRSADGAAADAVVKDQIPGHVQVYYTVIFNYPEYCQEPDDRFPETSPCTANGPIDRRDGLIPEVQFSVDVWTSTVVGENRKSTFTVDLSGDTPLQRLVADGPGLVNPLGAVIDVGVLDKGLLASAGPLREAQLNTLYGGCQGPPSFGPLSCHFVAGAQHLPPMAAIH